MKKNKISIAILMICILAISTTAFAAENTTKTNSFYQETVGVASAMLGYGNTVEYSGNKLTVSAQIKQIANSPTSLTIVLQQFYNSRWNSVENITIPINTEVQDVFNGLSIRTNTPTRLQFKLNGGAGSYVEVSMGIVSYN